MNNEKLTWLISKLDFTVKRRLPVIHQAESSECGLACLAMVCSYFGQNVNIMALRQLFSISSRGSSILTLRQLSSQLAMSSRVLSVELDQLNLVKKPCILHWDFNHFVVLAGVRKNKYIIHDPAAGRREVTKDEMSRLFTGIVLELWPGSEFTPQVEHKKISLRNLIKSIHGITGTLTKIFSIALVIEAMGFLLPIGTQLVMDHVIPASDSGLLALICTGLIIMVLLKTLLSLLKSWITLKMSTLINVQWQSGLFSHLLSLPVSYFERRKLGDIQSRFGSLNTIQTTFTSSLVGAIIDGMLIAGLLVMMLLYGNYLSYIVLGFSLFYISIRIFTYHRYKQLSEEALINNARSASFFMESLYGITSIKLQGMMSRRHSHWLNLQIDAINSGLRISKMDLFFGGLNTFISSIEQVLVLWLGISMILNNQMTIGMFIAFGSFRSQFSEKVYSFVSFLLQLRIMGLHNDRISDIALSETEQEKQDDGRTQNLFPAVLEVKNLDFRYDMSSHYILKSFNLNVEAGESIAIVGDSGSGKSTLMKLMCGLSAPESGQIFINGEDIQQKGINNYLKMIGCVMQDDRLFSGSIKDNICGFSEEIDDEWLMECARASHIHSVIMSMPMGYDTLIGELGEGLSGGQRQRIFIARALYRKPGILFLDEATSALDAKSEQAINAAIKNLKITRIIIAHRPDTINSADRIIRLD